MIFRKYLGYVFSPDIEFDSFLKRVEVDVMFQVHVLKFFFYWQHCRFSAKSDGQLELDVCY